MRQTLPAAALLAALLSACSTTDTTPPETAPVERAPEAVEVIPSQPETRPKPAPVAAYRPLLEKANAARSRGDYDESLALLERAQRIDPDGADIYLAMARTHQARGDKAQARAVAERGLLYCSGRSQCDALRAYAR